MLPGLPIRCRIIVSVAETPYQILLQRNVLCQRRVAFISVKHINHGDDDDNCIDDNGEDGDDDDDGDIWYV